MAKLSKISLCLLVLVLFYSSTLVYANSDKEKPELEYVESIGTYKVEITFNEEVDKTTAEDITNYKIAKYQGNKEHLNILRATLDESKTKVVIITEEQCRLLYSIDVTGVTDLAGNIIDYCKKSFVGTKSDIPEFRITNVKAITNNIVKVTFNYKIKKISAENIANYIIKDKNTNKEIKVINVELDSTGYVVTLTTDDIGSFIYNIEINNITSVSGKTLNNNKDFFRGGTSLEEFIVTEVECPSNDTVEITFNCEIKDYNINNLKNYGINKHNRKENIQIKNASISANRKTIILKTDTLSLILYQLKIKDIVSIWGQSLEPVTITFVGER